MLENSARVKEKQRHGCLTAWLVVIIFSGLISLIALVIGTIRHTSTANWSGLLIAIFVIAVLFDILCAVAIFRWKRWGFWGFCAVQVSGFIVNTIQGELVIISLVNMVISIAFLFWVLNIGGENKGWPQLE